MNYGQVLEEVKKGKLAQRTGWNGKGMFIFMRPADNLSLNYIDKVKSLPESFKAWVANIVAPAETTLTFTAYLCLKAADNTIVNGWLASQTDMLAEDWQILE